MALTSHSTLGIGVWDLGQVRKQGCHWYGLYVHIVRNNATEDCSDQQPCFCLNDTKLRIFSFDGKSLFPLREGDYSVKSLFAKDVLELEVSMHRRPNQSPPNRRDERLTIMNSMFRRSFSLMDTRSDIFCKTCYTRNIQGYDIS